LYAGGPQDVTLGQLKPYIGKKFIFQNRFCLIFIINQRSTQTTTFFQVWQKIRQPNDYLNQYIKEEFLAPIKTPECRNYVGLWFNDIQQGKFWALSSRSF
jgi:hypothetical protein